MAGRVLWSARMGGSVRHAPAVVDGVVFAADSAGLTALDAADGRARWTVPLPDGAAGRPRTVADVVYVATGARLVCAFDAATGAPRWQLATPAHRGTPTADGTGNLLVTTLDGFSRHQVTSLDPGTGEQRWAHEFHTPFVAEVTVAGDAVLVHHHHGTCVRLDAATGETVWSTPYGSRYYGYAPLTEHQGIVYAGSGDGDLYGLDLAAGAIRYGAPAIRTDLAARDRPGDIFYSQPHMRYAPSVQTAPLVAGDTVVTVQRNGLVSGRTLTLGARWADYADPPVDPVLTGTTERVFGVARHRLEARDVRTGQVVWKDRIGMALQPGGEPAGSGGTCYVGAGRRLRAYEA